MLKATLQLKKKKTNKQINKQLLKERRKFGRKVEKKLLRKGICLSKLSFFSLLFKEIQYEQIPKEKRKYFFYALSYLATLLSIC